MTVTRILALAVALAAAPAVSAQELQLTEPYDFWDIELGLHWSEQPQDYQEFACGTNGGPPSRRLTGFGDFALCEAEANGLHEVYFRYDDTVEYWARAMEFAPIVERYAGTKLFTFDVLISVLIDDEGIVRGLRAVTDDRVSDRARQLAFTLEASAQAYLGRTGWTCVDLPAREGEEPQGNQFIKRDCLKQAEDGRSFLTQARLLRRPGQTLFDPANNQVRQGYFESTGRLEIYDASIVVTLPDATDDEVTDE